MPLPDERPRQSVANLIGRFEQQVKRQPPPASPAVPRSSSVSSQIAGDAAKEDTKEKREWPPKSVESAEKPVLVSSAPSSSSILKSPTVSPPPPSSPHNDPFVMPADTAISASPEPAKPPAPKKQSVASGKATPTAGSRNHQTSPAKMRPSVSHTIKSPAKSPPKSSLASSISQPLRQQHTGQSTTSNASATRITRPTPRTAPSTPSRPKTPASHSIGNSASSRPKTPSSGLFAPTAASLARSRNAPHPPPPPIKKATLSSSAAERLSKPTAASMSKARTSGAAANPPTPARVAKSTSAGANVPRAGSKLRVGLAPARMKETKAKAQATSTVPREAEKTEATETQISHEGGHVPEESALSDPGVISSQEEVNVYDNEIINDEGEVITTDDVVLSNGELNAEPGIHEEPVVEVADAANVHPTPPSDLVEPEVHDDDRVEDPANVEEPAIAPDTPAEETLVEELPEHQVDRTESAQDFITEGEHPAGDDLEDIVNLLQSVPSIKALSGSIASIPDEHGEIPDEE